MKHPSAHAAVHPDKPAYIMAGSGEVVTYGALDRSSNQGAHVLRSLGVGAGDHIAIWMENNRHFFAIVWAAQRAGIIFTAISSHLSSHEAAYIVRNCDAKVLITSFELRGAAGEAALAIDASVHRFSVAGAVQGYASWEEACARMPEAPVQDQCAGVHMLYSSGTTGQPKGVYPVWAPHRPLDHIEPGMAALRDYFELGPDTVYLSPAPLYHAAPLIFNQLVMFQGGTSIIMEKFDAEHALALIARYGATIGQFVPIMFVRMLKLPEEVRAKYAITSLQRAIHAAAPCPVEIKQRMIDWWGPILFEYYSSTENAGATLLDTPQWLAHPGSVGRPLGCVVHILDVGGAELPVGETGEVFFENPRLNFEYYKEPERTAETRNEKGWVTIGDIGYLDAEGYLYLTDRKNFMIISGGVNIYPQEVENLLVNHDEVADIAVFGAPSAEFGQEVRAVVQPRRWPAREGLERDLIEWCKARLAHFKAPRAIDFVEALPRLDNGKLYKTKVVEDYQRRTESGARRSSGTA